MHNHLDVVEPKLPKFGHVLGLFDPETASSSWMKETLVQEGLVLKEYPLLVPFSALYYAMMMCQPARPLWQLDEDATALLLSHPLPENLLTSRIPRLPFHGMYVTIPPTALALEAIVRDESGHARKVKDIPYEGFYLCKDACIIDDKPTDAFTIVPIAYATQPSKAFFYPITIPFGRGKKGVSHLEVARQRIWNDFIGGQAEMLKLAMNLLVALEGDYIEMEELLARRRRVGAGGGNDAKERVTIIHLTKLGRSWLGELENQDYPETHASPTGHLRSEHWHSFWVLDPSGYEILEEKQRGERPSLFRVSKRVRECKVGVGPTRRPRYLVKE